MSPTGRCLRGLALALAPALLSSGPALAKLPATSSSAVAPTHVVGSAGTCAAIPLAASNAAFVDVPSAPGAWGGARTGHESTLSDRVVRYDIQATLDPAKHTIEGKQTLTWRNRSAQPVCAVYLHLYLNAFEGPGSTFMSEKRDNGFSFRSDVKVKDGDWGYIRLKRAAQAGQAVKWTFVQPDKGPTTDRTVVRFDLPQPVAPGASTTLDIDFFDQLPRVSARTGYYGSFHLVGQWFPKIGVLELPGERGATAPRWNAHELHLHSEFYADYGLYDVRITVPKGYTVGATGEEAGAPAEHDGKVTHRFVQGDVHDFAWTADNRYAKPLEGVYEGPGSPKVKVRVLYHPEYASNARPVLQATIDSLAYFSRTLGPYPYRTVTAVIPPYNATEAGGMEYPTFFTASSYENVDPGTAARYELDFVTIHEFGHGYFYGLLGSNEFEEPMLDEGLNEYWDLRMLRERKQGLPLANATIKRFARALELPGFEMERLGAKLDSSVDPLGANAWSRMSSGSYSSVYSRTATTMRDLEARVGTPALERAFKLYYARWKFRHPSIADLREALVEGTGNRAAVDQVFAQQVFSTHTIDDRIDGFKSIEVLPSAGYQEVHGDQVLLTTAAVRKDIAAKRKAWKDAHPHARPGSGPFPYRTTVMVLRKGADVPQTLRVRFADGSSRTVTFDGPRAWRRFTWETAAKAVSAQLDPDDSIFLDANKLDDGRTLRADASAARSFGGVVLAFFQSLFALLVSA